MADEPTDPLGARRAHWEAVYRDRPDDRLSWRQADPALSLRLIRAFATPDSAVLDVGAGESALSARLFEAGHRRLAALDVSESAIARAQARAGAAAQSIRWIVADVLAAPSLEPVDIWHDRAVFHFLTEASDRRRYVDLAAAAVRPGGHAILLTFAPDGPERCSDLPVRRYDAPALALEFGDRFELVRSEREDHTTPWEKVQPFTAAILRRKPGPP
ncbi:MAG: class I SAM-dependent methyltransferase [Phycisphaerales bacterium]|nr:class I SAM-dependent methyltransferase [Phycisphaerales bacterium]